MVGWGIFRALFKCKSKSKKQKNKTHFFDFFLFCFYWPFLNNQSSSLSPQLQERMNKLLWKRTSTVFGAWSFAPELLSTFPIWIWAPKLSARAERKRATGEAAAAEFRSRSWSRPRRCKKWRTRRASLRRRALPLHSEYDGNARHANDRNVRIPVSRWVPTCSSWGLRSRKWFWYG